MTSYSSKLFKEIMNAYYDNSFDEKIIELLSKSNVDKENMGKIISSLCGVDVDYSEDYVKDLKKAISNYSANHRVVTRVHNCCMECLSGEGDTSCQVSCPFNAIVADKNAKTVYIDEEKCRDCGSCVGACPSDNIMDRVEFIPIANILRENKTVIATVAPAIIGQFGKNVSINQLRAAIKKIGFSDMLEVAFFADMLTLREAIEFNKLVNNTEDFMISSCCCPVWVAMSKKIYGKLIKHVSPSVSPMIASGRAIKKINPDCKVVFIGPCVAKKAEAKEKDLLNDIDYVLTFTELKDIFEILNIHPEEMDEDTTHEYASREGRLYGHTGGVSTAVSEGIRISFPDKYPLLTTIQGNGVKECKQMLDDAQSGIIHGSFMEGMGCVGGCVGGPKIIIPKEEGRERLKEFAEGSEIRISFDSQPMHAFLQKLGGSTKTLTEIEETLNLFEREF
ncbi:MAG: iron hydrogenase [Clostridiales bacterium]|jgi:iron only hydrogenase large subunit-like protein|nr:iron hydrogenase [Clostridiales bacterium]